MLSFENLIAYKKSLQLTQHIYSVTKTWPKSELFALTDQCKRCTCSIALNVAEGSSRSKKDFCHFLDIARGSCFECVAILSIAKNEAFITSTQFAALYNEIEELIKIIHGLKRSLTMNYSL